jgi:hypothetical protein
VTDDAVFTAEPFADVYATSGGVPAPADDEPRVAVTLATSAITRSER